MAKKEFSYKGKSLDDLKKLSVNEFMELLPSRQRRTIKRGFTEEQKILLKKIRAGKDNVKTHVKNLVIIPELVGKTLRVHRGNSFEAIRISQEMVGHYIGEFIYTRKRVEHSSPGVGATRSSASISVR